ncbi:MAG: NUDIX domain-containing protein [Pseudomonadota bacterium]
MASGPLIHAFAVVIRPLLHQYWRLSRGLTIGVRGLVLDAQGRVFLVRHSYVSGWHLPGGGVETGETLAAALARELREEGSIELIDPPELYAIYWNRRQEWRDHIALYVVRSFRQSAPPRPNWEIVDHGFFALDSLPRGITASTRARIAEVLNQNTEAEIW